MPEQRSPICPHIHFVCKIMEWLKKLKYTTESRMKKKKEEEKGNTDFRIKFEYFNVCCSHINTSKSNRQSMHVELWFANKIRFLPLCDVYKFSDFLLWKLNKWKRLFIWILSYFFSFFSRIFRLLITKCSIFILNVAKELRKKRRRR